MARRSDRVYRGSSTPAQRLWRTKMVTLAMDTAMVGIFTVILLRWWGLI